MTPEQKTTYDRHNKQAIGTYKESANKLVQALYTVDGARKCFKFNQERPCDGNCGRSHTCLFCGEPHTAKWHKQRMQGKA